MKATNQVIVSGRLANEAQIRQFANSTKATFSLAINRQEQRGEETIRSVAYQPCEVWKKMEVQTLSLSSQREPMFKSLDG